MHRHDLVWLDPQAALTALSAGDEPRLRSWLQARLPLVVARRDPPADADQLRLGVPLPLAEGRARLALRVAADQVQRLQPPPLLEEVLHSAPAAWQAALQALQASCRTLPASPRVFGSFAWQALTGLPYLHAGSDLDLLWEVDGPGQAKAICRVLQRWEHQHGMRADGELRFGGNAAVNWREYAGAAPQVLVKADAACWLSARDELECLGSARLWQGEAG